MEPKRANQKPCLSLNAMGDLQDNLAPFYYHRATNTLAEGGKAEGTDMVGANGAACSVLPQTK